MEKKARTVILVSWAKKRKALSNRREATAATRCCLNRYSGYSLAPRCKRERVFIQLMIDGATGHMQGFTMRKKSETADAILKGLRKLYLAVGKKVKGYHADNEKKHRTKKLIAALETNGT